MKITLKLPEIGPGTVCLSGLLFLVLFIGYVGGLASLVALGTFIAVVAALAGVIIGGALWWVERS